MAKESLVVHVQKLLFKKYMKNPHIYIYIYIYINKLSRGEENNIRTDHASTWLLKNNFEVCFTFIVFMINLANLEINYQFLS